MKRRWSLGFLSHESARRAKRKKKEKRKKKKTQSQLKGEANKSTRITQALIIVNCILQAQVLALLNEECSLFCAQ